MESIVPPRLHPGSHVRVVAPARSRAFVTRGNDNATIADAALRALGLEVSFGEHVDELDAFASSSIESRVAALHAAFADPDVDAVLTVIGGTSSNELLPHLDLSLLVAHPTIVCGYSDITALLGAIRAMTGLVTYLGPHWSTFGMRDHNEQTVDWFRRMLMADDPVEVTAPARWTDDPWFLDQEDREVLDTDGWWTLAPGSMSGRIEGGNLCTLNLLQGTRWMPSLDDAVLFLEDDERSNPVDFRRDLHSLLQQPGAETVRGLVIGRFQRASGVTRADLEAIVASVPALRGKPVLANVDLGHTSPMLTVPLGGEADVDADRREITFTRH